MEDNLINLLKDKPLVLPKIFLSNYRKLNITDSELIIIMILYNNGNKIVYNPEEFAKCISSSKHEVMKLINSLIEKNIISIVIDRNNRKSCEYISLELLYKKIFNIIIDKNSESEEEPTTNIFSIFESELGRTLSPMEYEQIKEWLTSGLSQELISSALKEAVLNGIGNFRYIDTILNDWRKKGYKNKEDVIKDREKYRSKKNKVEVYDTDWLNE
ncbi:MAG: DnaD domain protein [Mycoplasmatota bacterium]|nr:DnaD domain protein [Mycoplasmatota bacterium]